MILLYKRKQLVCDTNIKYNNISYFVQSGQVNYNN